MSSFPLSRFQPSPKPNEINQSIIVTGGHDIRYRAQSFFSSNIGYDLEFLYVLGKGLFRYAPSPIVQKSMNHYFRIRKRCELLLFHTKICNYFERTNNDSYLKLKGQCHENFF